MKVRTRFAPSPTGYMHIGSLRTALYAYAFAKSQDGTFILRIEDTDRNRFVPGSTEKIYEQLKLFGINWDEQYVQSERVATGIYKKYADQLVNGDHAFYCFCKPKTKEEIKEAHENKISDMRDLVCRNLTPEEITKKIASGEKPAIRLKVPDKEIISFYDFVLKKDISWKSEFVDDAMLLKSDGFPTYQLGVVVDDATMEMTHIIRALEWLPSTPIHILLFKYLGFKLPEIGHLTDILDPEGGKLSKRKGNVSTEDFIAAGYLPEAILNFIILIGWAPKDNRELYTIEEFVKDFNVNGLQKANAVFHQEKLDWFNKQYTKKLSDEELTDKLSKFSVHNPEEIKKVVHLVRDRLVTLKDFDSLTEYFFTKPGVGPQNPEILKHAISVLEKTFDGKIFEEQARIFCAEKNIKVGDYFMNLRMAITGKPNTPPLWDIMLVLGNAQTLDRLKSATKPA